MITIRNATIDDIDKISGLEALCFPENEAASREAFKGRLLYYPEHFWLLFEDDLLISFIDGFVTNERDLKDEMYDSPNMHDESGDWQMIFGINTLQKYRNHGYASTLINHVIKEAKAQKRKGVVLTCKEKLIPFYEKLGFINEGISSSVHGNTVWYQMRYAFND